ncbi:MAG: GNAT family N-acetyltransferase [Pseudomonadota bacterium]|nr:GNAT family N-acetyltransferase [Pseudomonadota bacterium]
MRIKIEPVVAPNGDTEALVGELEAELSANYEPHQRHGLTLAALFQPHIRFYVACVDGVAAGCGGVALLDGLAELKRMYARPAFRGRGVAAALLARLAEDAAAAGYPRLCLETGTAQHAALRFYAGAGFVRCDAFGAYRFMAPAQVAESVFMEKRLDLASAGLSA